MRKNWKKVLAMILAASMVLTMQLSAFAAEAESVAADPEKTETAVEPAAEPVQDVPEAQTQTADETVNQVESAPAETEAAPEAAPSTETAEPAPEVTGGAAAEASAAAVVEEAAAETVQAVAEAAVAEAVVKEVPAVTGAPAAAGEDEKKASSKKDKEDKEKEEVQEVQEALEIQEAEAEFEPQDEMEALPLDDDAKVKTAKESLSKNYLRFLPKYRRVVSIDSATYKLNYEDVPVNFVPLGADPVYCPGEATVQMIDLCDKADIAKSGDKNLIMFVEYFDSNEKYDARTRGWNKVYTRIKKEGKKKKGTVTDAVAGNAGLSNSVSINVALAWVQVSGNGAMVIDDSVKPLAGVRVASAIFKNGKNATISGNGQWLPTKYAQREKNQDNSCFSIQIAHVKKDSGLTAKQLRLINKALKWKKKDNEDTRFKFGVTQRELAGNGQYDKLVYKIKDNGQLNTNKKKLEIKGVKIRIRFKNGTASDGEESTSTAEMNTFMTKYINVKLPTPKNIMSKEKAESNIKYGAYIKAADEDKIVIAGVGNFCGEAYWFKNSETGTFSLQ